MKIVENQYISRMKKYEHLYFQMQLSRFNGFDFPAHPQLVIFVRLNWDWCHFVREDSGEVLYDLLFSIFAYFSHKRGKYGRKKSFFSFLKNPKFWKAVKKMRGRN